MKVKKGSWTVINTKKVYENPWISVREDKVIRPDGKRGIFGVVTMKPGVSILPVDKDGNVFLTKEYHYGIEKVTVEAVSGGIDNNETKEEAAKRELREEVGLTSNRWTYLGLVDPFTTAVVSPNYMFLAENLVESNIKPEETEKIKVIKIPFKKAFEWATNGIITHSASVVLILKTATLLKKQKVRPYK